MENCIYCGKEQTIEIRSFIPGAVFVCRNSGSEIVYVMPAHWYLLKRRGCVEFGISLAGGDFEPFGVSNHYCLTLPLNVCESIYLDVPAPEEAWLVTPTKDGYDWKHIDPDIAFTV